MKILNAGLLSILTVSASQALADISPLMDVNSNQYNITQEYQSIEQMKRNLTMQIAKNYSSLSTTLNSQINQYNLKVNASEISGINRGLTADFEMANISTRSKQGLNRSGKQLYQIRLADKSMINDLQYGESPLFAFAPKGNDSEWTHIEAFDVNGNIVLLDAHELPKTPVFIVELDSKQSLKEGLAVMRSTLGAASIQNSRKTASYGNSFDDEPISTSILKKIRLNDDEEPWISGKAEVYGIVNGVSPSRDEPVLDIIDMPYLDYDQTNYYPNQIFVHWERYRWQAADMILMEQDDNINYKEIGGKLLEIATQVIRKIPDLEAQGYAIIPQITNQILQALPDSLTTNDDDYLDVFYTIFEGQNYTSHYGASSNAQVSIDSVIINPRN